MGREWLVAAQQVVAKGVPLKGESPLLFHAHPAMCLINYCESLEEEGTFGEVAKNAWKKAADSWTEFSNRDLPTVYNFTVRLYEKEAFEEQSQQAQAELNRLAPPGTREKIVEEKLSTLSEKEREAKDTPPDQLTNEQRTIRLEVGQKLAVKHLEIADRVTGENRAAALEAAQRAAQADFIANAIDIERGIVNFDYWLVRCQVEPEDDTLAARKLIYDGDKAFLAVQLLQAKESYIKGFEKWRQVLDAQPKLMDANLTDELVDSITHYQSLLHQLDEPFPKPFLLQDVVDKDMQFHGPRMGTQVPTSTDAAKPEADATKPAAEAPK